MTSATTEDGPRWAVIRYHPDSNLNDDVAYLSGWHNSYVAALALAESLTAKNNYFGSAVVRVEKLINGTGGKQAGKSKIKKPAQ
jgi:hypothetical protein